jgi:hypothetical protein
VEVLAEENNEDEAVETLQRIWFAEPELPAWPAEYAWKAAERGHFDNEVYQEARWRLARGSRPTPTALSLMAAHAMDWESLKKKARQPHWRTWIPGPGAQEVRALLGMVDRAQWADGHYRAVLLRCLCEFGYQRLAVRYWKGNRAAVENHVDSWAEVGRALVSLDRKEQARKVLKDWRERAGVPMWAVANYVLCFSRREALDLKEVLYTCTDALASLTHDHCAKYLAHVQAEMCALLGDTEAFRTTWLKHKGYFTGELKKGEWFESRHRHLLSDIPHLADLLERHQISQFRAASQELCEKQFSVPPVRTTREHLPVTGGMPAWLWLIIIWMAVSALAQFFSQTAPR